LPFAQQESDFSGCRFLRLDHVEANRGSDCRHRKRGDFDDQFLFRRSAPESLDQSHEYVSDNHRRCIAAPPLFTVAPQ
jgi:hypothetical protein